ncbi:MAG: ATP-binding protein, partial [Methanothermobacter tenebrarum]
MEEGIIEVDPRHTTRSIRSAIQGNVIRALVELITNSDDSYIRLEEHGSKVDGKIEIFYKKDGYSCIFAVRDFAEGMSLEDIKNNFRKYGPATSGLKEGKRVRGYFGQGAKDALASMIDGKICTFKNDVYVECELFIKDKKPMYRIKEPINAT